MSQNKIFIKSIFMLASFPLAAETTIIVTPEERNTRLTSQIAEQQARQNKIAGGTNLILPQEQVRLATLQDALDYQPGVTIQPFSGGSDQPRLNIRGSGAQSFPMTRGVVLLEDDLPLNDADGTFSISLLDFRSAGVVAIQRGANARSPFAQALGGEVNLLTLSGYDTPGKLSYDYGSFGRQGWHAAAGGEYGNYDGVISYSGDRFNGYREHSTSQRNLLFARTGYQVNEHLRQQLNISWRDVGFNIAGTLSKTQLENNPRFSNPNFRSADPQRNVGQFRLADKLIWQQDAVRHMLGGWWQYTHDNLVTPTNFNLSNTRSGGLLWESAWQYAAMDFRLAAGWEKSSGDRQLWGNLNDKKIRYLGSWDLSADNLHLAHSTGWQFHSDWRVNADVRATRARRDARQTDGCVGGTTTYHFMSPALGLIWSPANDLQLYANISGSNEVPTFRDMLNASRVKARYDELDRQRAVTIEAGIKGKISATANAELTLYRSTIKDELIDVHDERGYALGTLNYQGKTRHQGVEAGIRDSVSIGPGTLHWQTSWTWNDFRFEEGIYAGNRIAGIPRHVIAASVAWQFHRWQAGPTLNWVPDSVPVDHSNSGLQERDPYVILGFTLNYQPTDSLQLWLRGENLTDERYASMSVAIPRVTTEKAATQMPGVGRSISAGMSYRF